MSIKDFEVILDSMQMTAVYVIREDNHEILYYNKRVKEITPNLEIGMVCHEVWSGSCVNCALRYIGDKNESRAVKYDDPFGKVVDMVATRMLWEGQIPAFLITLTPHVEVSSYTYYRIVRGNLTTGSYEVMKLDQKLQEKGTICTNLTEFFSSFLKNRYIHPADEERFVQFTIIDCIKEELRAGKRTLSTTFRCKAQGDYRWYIMEIVPDFDYSDENQTIRLYTKDVDDIYREGIECAQKNVPNNEIIESLGELNFGIYVIALSTGKVNPMRTSENIEKLYASGMDQWDEILNKMLEQCIHPDYKEEFDRKFSLAALRNAWEQGDKKVRMLCRQMFFGEYHYSSVTARFYSNRENGGYVVLALQDVDDHTRRDFERGRNDKRMAAIVRSRFNVMSTVHLETGRCERVFLERSKAPSVLRVGDYEEYIDKALKECIHEEDRELFRKNFLLENLRKNAKEASEYKEVICQYRIKGEAVRWVEEHIIYTHTEYGNIVSILGRDVTKEKLEKEHELRTAREKANIIKCMSSMFFASYYIDLEHDTYHMVTQIAEVGRALGGERKCSEAFHTYAEKFVHPEEREEYLNRMSYRSLVKNLDQDHPIVAVEYRRIKNREDGTIEPDGWIRASVVLAETENGRPKTALYVAQEITESKEKEEEQYHALQEACDAANHANAAKSEFLSRMSHDIRTPMNAIIGMTTIAGTHLDDQERVSDCLNKIAVSSKHLLSLINEVLDMSKIESGKIDLTEEEFNLSDVIQNLLTMIRPAVQAKQHELELHIARVDHEEVIGDVMRLQRVFMNLLGNAVKYTPAGGKLELEITEKESNLYGYGCYEFVFKDNGIGMDDEFQRKIFDPFSRAEDSRISKIEGTGLGMTIAQNIVRMMNGSICVESEKGKGSQFTVTVFLKQQKTTAPNLEQFAGLPVLVVDDDICACETTCEVLEDIGMRGEWVLSGREAVDHIWKAHQEGKDFFAVILDWKMPEMDGMETAEKIRQKVGDEIKIIILSAEDWTMIEPEARMAGVDGFISKPLFKSRLVYMLKKVAGKEDPVEAKSAESSPELILSGKKVLLAEDNELNREIAEELIGNTGVSVESAKNGREALEKFENSEEGYYDLIFMDIQMPVMNGYEAARAIRSIERKDAVTIPIIAMTANAFSEDVAASKRAGMNEHISKPLDIEQLMVCLNRWLG